MPRTKPSPAKGPSRFSPPRSPQTPVERARLIDRIEASPRIEVLTGVNLPMLLKLTKTPAEQDLVALARVVCDDGRSAIRVASDLLRADREAGPRREARPDDDGSTAG